MKKVIIKIGAIICLVLFISCGRGGVPTSVPVQSGESSQYEIIEPPILPEQSISTLPTDSMGSAESESIQPTEPLEQSTDTSVIISDTDHLVVGSVPITPQKYQALLGKGMDVDWSKTSAGRASYTRKTVEDFKKAGVEHVRIRVKDDVGEELFASLDRQLADCLAIGVVPVLAYQGDAFKNNPSEKNIQKVVGWWTTVAERYQDLSYLLSFDLLIEATDALNTQPEKLNEIYERLVSAIRTSNPDRIIMMSPRLRSDAAYLHELKLPTDHNGYMMAEWHFYAAGPSKENERKLWTVGTEKEKQLILDKIQLALEWQKATGVPTWVGAWMAGNYNDGDDYSIEEQVTFSTFVTQALENAGIPFAVNSDTKFYDRETQAWVVEMRPVFEAIYN